ATLLVIAQLRAKRAAELGEAANTSATAGLAAATLLAWAIVVVAVGALLLGYVSLSLMLSQMVAWTTVVGSSVYLLMAAVDDIATTLF
ncbi:hypothetical protein, partial [Clostridium perfringens]